LIHTNLVVQIDAADFKALKTWITIPISMQTPHAQYTFHLIVSGFQGWNGDLSLNPYFFVFLLTVQHRVWIWLL